MTRLSLGLIIDHTQFDGSRPIAKGKLGPGAATMLTLLYGLDGKPKLSVKEIAERQGVKHERISILYRKYLILLKRHYPDLVVDRKEY